MASNPELLKLLELVFQSRQHYHSTLWEEEKHYSWWVYIIFAGLIYLYFKLLPPVTLLVPWQKALIMGLGSLFGFFISIVGHKVVRRESEYFYEARQMYDRIIIALRLNQPMPDPYSSESFFPYQVRVEDWKCVRSQANKPLHKLIGGLFKRNLGIRDHFQLSFLVAALLFAGFGIFSIITLLN